MEAAQLKSQSLFAVYLMIPLLEKHVYQWHLKLNRSQLQYKLEEMAKLKVYKPICKHSSSTCTPAASKMALDTPRLQIKSGTYISNNSL